MIIKTINMYKKKETKLEKAKREDKSLTRIFTYMNIDAVKTKDITECWHAPKNTDGNLSRYRVFIPQYEYPNGRKGVLIVKTKFMDLHKMTSVTRQNPGSPPEDINEMSLTISDNPQHSLITSFGKIVSDFTIKYMQETLFADENIDTEEYHLSPLFAHIECEDDNYYSTNIKLKDSVKILNYNVHKDFPDVEEIDVKDRKRLYHVFNTSKKEKEIRILFAFKGWTMVSPQNMMGVKMIPYRIEIKYKGAHIKSDLDEMSKEIRPYIKKISI
jgi:hypothetical protein